MKVVDEEGFEYLLPKFVLPALQLLGLNPSISSVDSLIGGSGGEGKVYRNVFVRFAELLQHTEACGDTLERCFKIELLQNNGERSE
jgi:hypothetical protein